MNWDLDIESSATKVRRLEAAPSTSIKYRVIYADTDAMGIVYHGRYLEIAERSRIDFIANSIFDPGELESDHKIQLVVNRVRADYRIPIRMHEVADVATSALKVGVSQVWWRTQMFVHGRLAANVDVGTGCYHVPTREPTALPLAFASAIAALLR